MVFVQNHQPVEGVDQHRVHLIGLGGNAEVQPEEVFDKAPVVIRIHQRLANAFLVGVGRDHGKFCQEANGGDFDLFGIFRVEGVTVIGGEGTDRTGEHRHGVSGVGKSVEEAFQVFVQEGVPAHGVVKFG
ncbi:MAG: Uncharacterised protein [Cellulomonadaceae bacterium TMED98]|nr:MAG: Uncharacterised protein [Cellulomonadaceae bacterium TMED98]